MSITSAGNRGESGQARFNDKMCGVIFQKAMRFVKEKLKQYLEFFLYFTILSK